MRMGSGLERKVPDCVPNGLCSEDIAVENVRSHDSEPTADNGNVPTSPESAVAQRGEKRGTIPGLTEDLWDCPL